MDQKWIALLSHFSRVEITASLDGLHQVNEYIRYPSQWDRVKENLDLFYKTYPKNDLSLMIVVQVMNVLQLPQIMEWLITQYPERQLQLIPTILQGPRYLSIGILTENLRKLAHDNIQKLLDKKTLSEDNQRHFINILEHLKGSHPDSQHLRNQFRQYVHYLDQQRGTHFLDTFPELQELIHEAPVLLQT